MPPALGTKPDKENMPGRGQLLSKAVAIVTAYVTHNQIPAGEIPAAIQSVHIALSNLSGGSAESPHLQPAVPIKKSIGDDFIICLEDGKKLTMLKRYLRTQYDMRPEEYRKKWDLPHDYPMVAPAYARIRSAFAKKIGLGRIPTGTRGGGRRKKA